MSQHTSYPANGSSPVATAPTLIDFGRVLLRYPLRWLLPTAAVAALGLYYAAKKSDIWEASQALIVRQEATGGSAQPNRAPHAEEIRSAQETILELAKSPALVTAALQQIGPPANRADDTDWPTADDVGRLQSNIKMLPPKGAEFGKTEVFYLKVLDKNRERAIALATTISDLLQARFMQLRDVKSRSLVDELTRAVALAQDDLNSTTARLTSMEKQVGSDLAELRILQESPSGDSQLRRGTIEMENELRQTRSNQQVNRELLNLLELSQNDARNLLAAPSRLLESQPALKRLKDGLVDAQLRSAQVNGLMSAEHPQAIVARAAEAEVSQHLHNEIETAKRGVELDLRLSQNRIEFLEGELSKSRQRMDRLAALRASYGNLVAEVRHRTDILKTAEQDLAEARAGQATANTASLISRIDTPDDGGSPVGPSRVMIALGAILGGLLVGIGLTLLTAPSATNRLASASKEPTAVATPPIQNAIDYTAVTAGASLPETNVSTFDSHRFNSAAGHVRDTKPATRSLISDVKEEPVTELTLVQHEPGDELPSESASQRPTERFDAVPQQVRLAAIDPAELKQAWQHTPREALTH